MNPPVTTCPTCGTEVSPNAKGCRACGARREEAGWRQPEAYDGLDIPGDEFDYEEFIEREFGQGKAKRDPRQVFWWIVAVITLIAFAWLALMGW